MESLNEKKTVEIFDQLVSEGIIIYGPHEKIIENCGGYPLEFRVCPSLSKKPYTVDSPLDPAFNKSKKWGPGSDMYIPDERVILTKLNNTHDLALNMFCVDRPQFMMPTIDSYRRQDEPLDRDDFAAALDTIKALKDFFVIYNCTETAGCSRVHKHMQGLRGPPFAFEALISTTKDKDEAAIVPFQYFTYHFEQGFTNISAVDIVPIYTSLLRQARQALGVSEADICPHNVILWRDWIIVIPRRKSFVERACTNSVGMMGSVWLSESNLVDEWKRLGCRHVLEELGVPRKEPRQS